MRFVLLAVVVAVALAFGGAAMAADAVTLDGKVVCAKCQLKKADAKECQNVLVVKDKDGGDVQYYLARSEAADKFGMVCMKEKKVTVTGTVTEKDGRRWITATKIDEAAS
jgi:hypothetical protein